MFDAEPVRVELGFNFTSLRRSQVLKVRHRSAITIIIAKANAITVSSITIDRNPSSIS
jgi:hypothetical protein